MKDLDHKDCQNFDVVDHLTSNAIIDLLDHCGYIGTNVYLQLIWWIIDSLPFIC